MTDKITEWQRLCDEATEAPWVAQHNSIDEATVGSLAVPEMHGEGCLAVCGIDGESDAAFIAAARTALPLLLAEHDLLEAAWGLIANANEGFWERARPEWTEAAVRWGDRYHAVLAALEAAE